ncbi:CAAX prenyl protease-related protein [Candidatus Woesearchaeota archaeon]|nr:CAAX prenyl protease-related protein [Candidatus Woesearchaeota archaeon]
MIAYIISLIIYILLQPAAYFVYNNLFVSLLLKLGVLSIIMFYFKKYFKFKFRFDSFTILSGIIIAVIWIIIDDYYPHLGADQSLTWTIPAIFVKLIISIVIAPIIEEFFTRFFLSRWIINTSWEKIDEGKFTLNSFIITVLFFGFSHNRWLSGIIAGAILNYLFYKNKNIGSCVVSHSIANLILGIYVIITNSFNFW